MFSLHSKHTDASHPARKRPPHQDAFSAPPDSLHCSYPQGTQPSKSAAYSYCMPATPPECLPCPQYAYLLLHHACPASSMLLYSSSIPAMPLSPSTTVRLVARPSRRMSKRTRSPARRESSALKRSAELRTDFPSRPTITSPRITSPKMSLCVCRSPAAMPGEPGGTSSTSTPSCPSAANTWGGASVTPRVGREGLAVPMPPREPLLPMLTGAAMI
mmetsp:Transcript_21144/g.58703  ORF Transcript_21144/g.58703 Transcript_21144/m.58703 type:complete len:216 (-) Transcript_21144:2501-3148(-)